MTDIVASCSARTTRALTTAAALAILPFAATAQPTGDVEAGHRLAQTWCSNCHIVGSEQQRGTSTGAPAFTAIAVMKSTTSLSLHAFFQTPHERMPDLHLTRIEMNDVSAYILGLRR